MIGKKLSERLGLIGSKDFKYQGFQNVMLTSTGRLLAVVSLPVRPHIGLHRLPCPLGRDVLQRSATP